MNSSIKKTQLKFVADVLTTHEHLIIRFASFNNAVAYCKALVKAEKLIKAHIGCFIFGTMYTYKDGMESFDVGI